MAERRGGGRPGARHPFGQVANGLVWGGASLGMVQAVVFTIGFGTSPFWGGLQLADDASLGIVLAIVVLIGGTSAWLCWRALAAWRARDPAVLGRLFAAGLVLLPLGALHPTTLMYTPAGAMLCAAGFAARKRIVAAER